MESEKFIILNGKQYPRKLDILMEEENLIGDFVFKFIPYLIFPTSDKFPWFPILIDGKSVFISTSIKAIVKVRRQYSSLKPKLGILKALVHKTEPVCYIPKENNSGPFYLVTKQLYVKDKMGKKRINKTSKGKQLSKGPKNKESCFSQIIDVIGIPFGILGYLGENFLKLFRKG